ncbi:MAG TPA: hypothetical protein PKE04_23355, partial [Clostridia bacterium]|nr:hypothetical protein [Clostridia bacterium]
AGTLFSAFGSEKCAFSPRMSPKMITFREARPLELSGEGTLEAVVQGFLPAGRLFFFLLWGWGLVMAKFFAIARQNTSWRRFTFREQYCIVWSEKREFWKFRWV